MLLAFITKVFWQSDVLQSFLTAPANLNYGCNVGDILIFELDKSRSAITMKIHVDQTLSDEQVLARCIFTETIV